MFDFLKASKNIWLDAFSKKEISKDEFAMGFMSVVLLVITSSVIITILSDHVISSETSTILFATIMTVPMGVLTSASSRAKF